MHAWECASELLEACRARVCFLPSCELELGVRLSLCLTLVELLLGLVPVYVKIGVNGVHCGNGAM